MNRVTALPLRVLFGLLCACLSANAMNRIQGDCMQGGGAIFTNGIRATTRVMQSFVTLSGTTPVSGCTVTVYITGTVTKATLFSNNGGTPLANPFIADATGHWYFYVPNRRYDVTLSGAGIPSPFTLGDIQAFDPSIAVLDITQYGAVCNGTTDDYTAIQAALDNNPAATINFPNGASCKSSATWVLSSQTPLRQFAGHLVGNGARITWTNDGSSGDTDANMQHGIGAYNRVNDPAVGASEIGGVDRVEIYGFFFTCPNYGACIFLGNSRFQLIHDNVFSGKSLAYNTATNPRHGIVIDCGINNHIDRNRFDSFTVGQVSIIKSGDTATGHVVYTNFPPLSGYFNDSPSVTRNNFEGSAPFSILEMGGGSFTIITIRNNNSGGGPKIWFFASCNGISATIEDNWTEQSTYFVGVLGASIPGNIPGTSIPHSYLKTAPGAPEHYMIRNNEFANGQVFFYSELIDGSYSTIENNRYNNVTPGTSVWITGASSANFVDFRDNNLVIYLAQTWLATDRAINIPSVVAIKSTIYPNTIKINGRMNPTCALHNVSVSGSSWYIDGVFNTATFPLTFQYIYFLDGMPANSVITGISLKTVTAFTGSGFTTVNATVGDGLGSDTPPASETWYTSTPYDLAASVSNINHQEFVIFRAPRDISVGRTFMAFHANQNFSAASITGSLNINVCWAVMQ